MEEHSLQNCATRVWNMDETGVQLQHKPGKVSTKQDKW